MWTDLIDVKACVGKIATNVVAVDDRGIKIKMWGLGKRGMTMNDDSNG